MEALNKYLSKQTVKTLDGEKLYTFRLLRKKEAARIYHTTVSTVLAAIAQAAGGEGPTAKLDAIKAIDFDTFWGLARVVLRKCDIRPDPDNPDFFITIDDLDNAEYFDELREELYIAVYYGLKANYPKSWGRIEKAIAGFGPRIAAMANQLNTVSTPGSSLAATSPSSTESPPLK